MAVRRKTQRRASEMDALEVLADRVGEDEGFGRDGCICGASRITENGGSGKKIARAAKPVRLARSAARIDRATQ
jgi:hypothetical protein